VDTSPAAPAEHAVRAHGVATTVAGKVTRRLSIRGKVQGVGFREAMAREALRLRITGWVRNRHDGRVEAVVQGTPEAVLAIIDWSHRGPPAAHVVDVAVHDEGGEYRSFMRYPTA
jgi:acylphosphatase